MSVLDILIDQRFQKLFLHLKRKYVRISQIPKIQRFKDSKIVLQHALSDRSSVNELIRKNVEIEDFAIFLADFDILLLILF